MPAVVDEDVAKVVDRAYRLILGRSPDPVGGASYERALRSGALTVPELCADLARSAEFADRMNPAPPVQEAQPAPQDEPEPDPDWIYPADLIKAVGVEELNERAEGYFLAVEEPDELLAKPLSNLLETPDMLVNFGSVLRALRPLPGMTVLDFGAGACWTSRFLTQLGCRVIALDVSPTALGLGRRLYAEMPVVGERPEPEFLVYDGHRFDLPDASVDRVLCFDAFHHSPDPAATLREMARVLRPGGIAAFSEPGDRHSTNPRSQFEMRHYGILENDVVVDDVWAWAHEAGFAELNLAMFAPAPHWVDLTTYHRILDNPTEDAGLGPAYATMRDRLIFRLRRDGIEPRDSRDTEGLAGELTVDDLRVDTSGPTAVLTATCHAHNSGRNTWLPSYTLCGGVGLGVRLHVPGEPVRDLARLELPGAGLPPGERLTCPIRVELPEAPPPSAEVEFDLVSVRICWFSVNGSPGVTLPIPR